MNSLDIEDSNTKVKSLKLRRKSYVSGVSKIKDFDLDILGFFSMNSKYEFCDNITQLRYIHLPPHNKNVYYDLKHNSRETIQKNYSANIVKLDPILKWIISRRQEGMDLRRCIGDFVTFRGVLSQIMFTPYENNDGWIICATQLQGSVYMCKYDTQEMIDAEQNKCIWSQNVCDWGKKFEQFLLSEHPNRPPDVDKPDNHNEEFNCVFRASIGPYNLVYSAEMDGVQLSKNMAAVSNNSNRLIRMLKEKDAAFMELKTCAQKSTKEWNKMCRFKSRKWWAQCYLAGVKNVICGYRNNQGIVNLLEKFSVRDLPEIGKGFWNPNVCLQYLVDFLKLVKEQVSSGRDGQLWKFTWNPKHEPDSIQVELCDCNSPYFFLHKWATDKLASPKRKNEETFGGSSKSRKHH